MSELNDRQWAVLSEKGCEASNLTYDEAVQLVRGLAEEKVHGLSIITDEAAHRIARRKNSPDPAHLPTLKKH
ncbi:MAG TPA: hypothetical protein VGB17_19570 [Pyrinomonadaceae bacterium]|jgi:hypothetical protein